MTDLVESTAVFLHTELVECPPHSLFKNLCIKHCLYFYDYNQDISISLGFIKLSNKTNLKSDD